MLVQKFDNFLQSVDLKSYRDMYRPIKIVEMDLPKEVQAIDALYKVYLKSFLIEFIALSGDKAGREWRNLHTES